MTYGKVNNRGEHTDVGTTLHGAKVSATRSGLTVVSVRSELGYNIDIVCRKVGGKWTHST